MILLIIWVLALLITLILSYCSKWIVHTSMIKEDTFSKNGNPVPYLAINFEDFKNLFDKQTFYRDSGFEESLFGFWDCELGTHVSEIHAGIIRFDYTNYIIKSPRQYKKIMKYINSEKSKFPFKSFSDTSFFINQNF